MSKRINVSIPKDSMDTLAEFDAHCTALGLTRSEVIIELMTQYNAAQEPTQSWQRELCEHAAQEPEVPDFLR